MHTFQRVINLLKNVNTSIRTYVICLILTSGRKNCAEMARTVNISQKKLSHFLSDAEKNLKEIEQHLFDFSKSTRNKKTKRTLVVDPSHIIKRYAQIMENLCYDKAGCTKNIEKTLVPVCASIVDQDITIPLNLDFWIQEKIIGKRKYKSKATITKELILYLMSKGIEFDFVSLDGAFAVPEIFAFFQQHNIKFIMRIPKNRCIVTSNGEKAQLKHLKILKLARNSREKTIQAQLKNGTIHYFFTAQKRKKEVVDGKLFFWLVI